MREVNVVRSRFFRNYAHSLRKSGTKRNRELPGSSLDRTSVVLSVSSLSVALIGIGANSDATKTRINSSFKTANAPEKIRVFIFDLLLGYASLFMLTALSCFSNRLNQLVGHISPPLAPIFAKLPPPSLRLTLSLAYGMFSHGVNREIFLIIFGPDKISCHFNRLRGD